MITASFFFDTRRLDKQGRGMLRLVVTKNGTRSTLSLGIPLLPNQWKDGLIVNHDNDVVLNRIISIKKGIVDRTILEQTALGTFAGKTAREVIEVLKENLDPEQAEISRRRKRDNELKKNSFMVYFKSFLLTKENPGTKSLYEDTFNKVQSFCDSEGIDSHRLTFAEISKPWLESFESYCLRTQKRNTVSRHLRDIRAVFNSAIDAEVTTHYPFRKFRIKQEITIDKSYSSNELRSFFSSTPYPGGEEEALDIFKLMFCLIGINSIDLVNAPIMCRGRIIYKRAKTHKQYSVKVEPEALAIIRKYEGETRLLNILDRFSNYKTYFNRMGKSLRKVGKTRVDGKRSEGEAILPNLCFGAARTSWATIAQEELDIPREVIAAALGHHTIDVTSTYLRTDWKKKVDNANRIVLDWVFYEKRPPSQDTILTELPIK